jgi:hypothetical protein
LVVGSGVVEADDLRIMEENALVIEGDALSSADNIGDIRIIEDDVGCVVLGV